MQKYINIYSWPGNRCFAREWMNIHNKFIKIGLPISEEFYDKHCGTRKLDKLLRDK